MAIFYRPITNGLLFLVSHALFGLEPVGYHVITFALFIMCGLMVYGIANALTGKKDVSLMASIFYVTRGALFMPVYWIAAGYNELTTAFFIFSSAYAYLYYLKDKKPALYAASLACAVLATMSKESAIILPLLILSVDLFRREWKAEGLRPRIMRLAPFFVITAAYAVRLYLIRGMMASGAYRMAPDPALILENLSYYVSAAFNGNLELVVLGMIIVVGLAMMKDRKLVYFSVAWFAVCILPYVFIVDHSYTYYLSAALLGPALILALCLAGLIGRLTAPGRENMVKITGFFLIALLLAYSGYASVKSQEKVSIITLQETVSDNVLSYLKNNVAYYPEDSLVYIEGADYGLYAALGYGGAAIKLNYGDNVSVYFENVTAGAPKNASHVYYYAYSKPTLKAIR